VTCELVREWLRRVESEADDGEEGEEEATSDATDSDSGDESDDVGAGLEDAALGVGSRRRKYRQSPFVDAALADSLGIRRDVGGGGDSDEEEVDAAGAMPKDVVDMVRLLHESSGLTDMAMRAMFKGHGDSDSDEDEDGDGGDAGSEGEGVNPALARRWDNDEMGAISKWVEVEDAGCGGVTMPGVPSDPVLTPMLSVRDPDHVAAINSAAAAAAASTGGSGAVVVEEEAVMLTVKRDAQPLTTLLTAMARSAGAGDPLVSHLVGEVRRELATQEADDLGTRLQQALAAGV